MTPLAIVEAIAACIWCYAGLTTLAWFRHARTQGRSAHVPAFADRLVNLVPAMIVLVVVILFGALFGLPSVVVFIAVLFPAGSSFGLHMTMRDISDADHWPRRAALALGLAALVVAYRQAG